LLHAQIAAHFPRVFHLARFARNLARHESELAYDNEWNVVAAWGSRRRQCDSKFRQPGFDFRAHMNTSRWK
jgi:hypothetical protein